MRLRAANSGPSRHRVPNVVPFWPAPMLAEALRYADELGWFVFPARFEPGAPGKSLKKFSWLKRETAPEHLNWGMSKDLKQVSIDFINPKFSAKCGIGIPTGEINGLFVVETDTKAGGHAADGAAGLAALEEKHGKLPPTRTAVSPSGSVHYYFRTIRAFASSVPTPSWLPASDVKGDGNMVAAPPSVRPDGAYRWLDEREIADAPEWLIEPVQGGRARDLGGENRTAGRGGPSSRKCRRTWPTIRKKRASRILGASSSRTRYAARANSCQPAKARMRLSGFQCAARSSGWGGKGTVLIWATRAGSRYSTIFRRGWMATKKIIRSMPALINGER